MNLDFIALNENLGWQRIAINEIARIGKVSQERRDKLVSMLEELETFNDQIITEYKANIVKTH